MNQSEDWRKYLDWDELGMGFPAEITRHGGKVKGNPKFYGYKVMITGDDNKPKVLPKDAPSSSSKPGEVISLDEAYRREGEKLNEFSSEEFADILKGKSADELMKLFEEGFRGAPNEWFGLNPVAQDMASRVIVSKGAPKGVNVIGVPNAWGTVSGKQDFYYDPMTGFDTSANQYHNKSKGDKVVGPLARDALRRLNRDNRTGVHEGRNSPISRLFADQFRQGSFYRDVLTEVDRKMFDEALAEDNSWDGLLKAFKNLELKGAEGRGIEQKNKREAIKSGFLNRIKSGVLWPYTFDSRSEAVPRGFMYNSLVHAITMALREASKIKGADGKPIDPRRVRLFQLFFPLSSLYNVEDVMEGKVTGNRSNMNEFMLDANVDIGSLLGNDLGGVDYFFGTKSPIRQYWIDVLSGAPEGAAWKKNLEGVLGTAKDVVGSDERIKNVRKLAVDSFKKETEPLMRQCFITQGVMRAL